MLHKMVKSTVSQIVQGYSSRQNGTERHLGTYEDAVCALNNLQSNEATIQKALLDQKNPTKNIKRMPLYLEATGIAMEDLDRLNVIHVAGTKGKGSTCAFTESILRAHGYKTGLYTSPHLVAVRERIRLDGVPLSKEQFARYFWQVYLPLKEQEKMKGAPMPAYFVFLTVMAFKVFTQEKVDVTVLEVGVGGEYDSTNVVRHPRVVGITSLGLDHTRLLGSTVRDIAWQKSGIMKEGIVALTVPQPDGGLEVLQERAQEKGCCLQLAPPLLSYDWDVRRCTLGIPGGPQEQNASLALQLSRVWLQKHASNCTKSERRDLPQVPVGEDFFLNIAPPFTISKLMARGLERCFWPGRCQVAPIARGLTLYLDGAHTLESLQCCLRWFREASAAEENVVARSGARVYRVLLFNCMGDRRPEMLLSLLVDHPFHFALFTPNRVSLKKSPYSDQSNFTVEESTEMSRCRANMQIWCHLQSSLQEEEQLQNGHDGYLSAGLQRPEDNCLLFPCIQDAVLWLRDQSMADQRRHIQVLVTGSLHLVGGVMSHVDPNLAFSCSDGTKSGSPGRQL